MSSSSLEIYQAFMVGYVRRINDATLKVPIKGVRIGHAKYTRLAQINLRTGIITFSRYAIENVPERCRRYLVIHELSHVKEARHNKRFWNTVAKYVPECRKVEMELQEAFQVNIRDHRLAELPSDVVMRERLEKPNLLLPPLPVAQDYDGLIHDDNIITDGSDDEIDDCFGGEEDEFGSWTSSPEGIVFGGTDIDPANI